MNEAGSYEEYREAVEQQRVRDHDRFTGAVPATDYVMDASNGMAVNVWIIPAGTLAAGSTVRFRGHGTVPSPATETIERMAAVLNRFWDECFRVYVEDLFERVATVFEQTGLINEPPNPKRGAGLTALRASVERRGMGRQWWIR